MRRARLRKTRLRILAAAFLALVQSPCAQEAPPHGDTGTVCVLPNSPDPPTRFSPGGEYNPATLTISIDKATPISWPHRQRIKIENLALDQRHLMVLRSDRKRIQSLWFRFINHKNYTQTTMCVAYDGYQGVQLGDPRTELWCKCK